MAQTAKNPPVMQVTNVRSLGQEDPLEKGIATHASILAWRIPWTEEPGGLQSMEVPKSQTQLSEYFMYSIISCVHVWNRISIHQYANMYAI